MARPAEVSELDRFKAPQNVLWLDVSMNHRLAMHVNESLCHLTDNVRCLGLTVPSVWLFLHLFVDAAMWRELHHHVDVILVAEDTIHR